LTPGVVLVLGNGREAGFLKAGYGKDGKEAIGEEET